MLTILLMALLSLIGPLWSVSHASTAGQTPVDYHFEDGMMPGAMTRMRVRPRILTEDDNSFLRITGSAGDRQAIPASLRYRNRSTVMVTPAPTAMPLIRDANRRQTYSAKLRFYGQKPQGVNFELYQHARATGGYGTRDGRGPVVIMWRLANGHVMMGANYANETKRTTFDAGFIPSATWHTYTVKAVWSHDPKVARLDFYVDGDLKGRVQGRGVNLGPTSNHLPAMKVGLYGDHAVGVLDVDDVHAGPSLAGGEGAEPEG